MMLESWPARAAVVRPSLLGRSGSGCCLCNSARKGVPQPQPLCEREPTKAQGWMDSPRFP